MASDAFGGDAYTPLMTREQAMRLRRWHERALRLGRRTTTITVRHLGYTFVVPPDVYEPSPNGLAEVVAGEVRPTDRVLDLGTGSGINAIVAGSTAHEVVAVDVSPAAVECARANVVRNGLSSAIEVRESDLFANVVGRYDLIVFDPPFRWFRPRSMRERASADENYRTLTAFFGHVRQYMAPGGRCLLAFGTTGDLRYLHRLITTTGFRVETVRRVDLSIDGAAVSYFAYRLTALDAGERGLSRDRTSR